MVFGEVELRAPSTGPSSLVEMLKKEQEMVKEYINDEEVKLA